MLCALKYFLPQWRQSKRSWWRRCWLPGWTRPPPTNIFNSFAVQEPPEKEVSQSWPLSFFPQSPQNATSYIPALSNTPVPLSQRPSCLRTCAKEKAINLNLIFVFWSTCFFSQHYTSTLSNRFSFPLSPTLLKRIATETLCNAGGAVSFRTAEESVENAKEVLNAFDRAIQKHKNRPKIEVPKRKFFPCFSIPVVSSL